MLFFLLVNDVEDMIIDDGSFNIELMTIGAYRSSLSYDIDDDNEDIKVFCAVEGRGESC